MITVKRRTRAALITVGLAAGIGLTAASPAAAITGGSETDELAGQVFISSFSNDGETGSCVGSLIGEEWVLTAGHCLTDDGGIVKDETDLAIGSAKKNEGKRFKIDDFFVNSKADVGLIKLEEDADDDLVVRWSKKEAPKVDERVRMRGWGGLNNGDKLRVAEQKVTSTAPTDSPDNDRLVSEDTGDGQINDGDSGAAVTTTDSNTVRAVISTGGGGEVGSVVLADVAEWIDEVSDIDADD